MDEARPGKVDGSSLYRAVDKQDAKVGRLNLFIQSTERFRCWTAVERIQITNRCSVPTKRPSIRRDVLKKKKKRDRLGNDFTIALGDCGCLVAYPQEKWLQIYNDIMRYESINQGRQQYTRLVLALADDELNFDGEGRFVVPSKLRELAKLKDEVVILGCGDRLEIWSVEEYAEFTKYPDAYAKDRREAIENAYSKMVGRVA